MVAAHFDTARTFTYSKNFQWSPGTYRKVTIFPDKEDSLARFTFWTSLFETSDPGYDLLYPATPFEKILVEYMSFDNGFHSTSQYGNALSASMELLDSSYIRKTEVTNGVYDMEFPKGNLSCYRAVFRNNNVWWNCYLPASKMQLSVPDVHIDLSKTRYAKDISLTGFSLENVTLFNGDYKGYPDFFNYVFASDALGKNRFNLYQQFMQ